ncbi:hypothetical protein QE152_g5526 [Popillia japonica]|uniref:Uncharacterized protein n=1 Tax=Popillia japonica TaxID=7064 RepID=A0AAW1MPP8_POPJA
MNTANYIHKSHRRSDQIACHDFVLQQDSVALHRAQIVKNHFRRKEISVLEQSGIPTAGKDNLTQFMDLRTCILMEWESIEQKLIQKLVMDSLPKRMLQVIEKRDGPTHY